MEIAEKFYDVIERIVKGEKPLSYSALSAFSKSPKHYYKYIMEKETTEAMEQGKRFHMALLEPKAFTKRYATFDDSKKVEEILRDGYLDSKGKVKTTDNPRQVGPYQKWKAEQMAIYAEAGKEVIEEDEMVMYANMIEALKDHKGDDDSMGASELLYGVDGENEVSKYFEHDGFKYITKIDRATPEFTVDLKKVADASYQKVKWDISRMNYDLQGGMYSLGNNTQRHYLIYIDKGCNITIVEAGGMVIDGWKVKFEVAVNQFRRAIEEDSWNMSYNFYQPVVRL